MLEGNKTLSVKTNKSKLGKAAPQNVGQPTSTTYFDHFKGTAGPISAGLSFSEKAYLFKKNSIENIDIIMPIYWQNMFDCDYLLYIYEVVSNGSGVSIDVKYRVFKKDSHDVVWDKSKFTFTKDLSTWNESCTVKYNNITIGEFQAHQHRNCFKFRFNFKGIEKLIELQII